MQTYLVTVKPRGVKIRVKAENAPMAHYRAMQLGFRTERAVPERRPA